jgi:hypothetical protein
MAAKLRETGYKATRKQRLFPISMGETIRESLSPGNKKSRARARLEKQQSCKGELVCLGASKHPI